LCSAGDGSGEAVNYQQLEFVVELTNAMQTVSFSFNYVLYALINVQFRRALRDVVCWRFAPSADQTPPVRGQAVVDLMDRPW